MSQHHNENCHVDAFEKPLERGALAEAQAVYLAVSGMGCPRCAVRVNNSLLRLDGVLLSETVLDECLAMVAYDPEAVTPSDLVRAVAEAGNDGRHHYAGRILAHLPAREVFQV